MEKNSPSMVVAESSMASLYQSLAVIYGALARLYHDPPDRETLDELERTGFLKLMSEVCQEEVNANLLQTDPEEIAAEYARLFLGPGRHVSPYASVYRKDDPRSGELWGHTTGEVNRFLKHCGLSLRETGAIPDHIAILFEFMQKVVLTIHQLIVSERPQSKKNEEMKIAVELQRDFFTNYISCWMDAFLDAVEEADPGSIYRILVRFTRQFIEKERLNLTPSLTESG